MTPKPASTGRSSFVLRSLLRYLWPPGHVGLRARVVVALSFIFAAKVLNVWVPIFYKQAVDALGAEGGFVRLPLLAIAAYGLAKTGSTVFNQLRDAIFEHVAQRAMRRSALEVFTHLHGLSLRFHLERRTGALSRDIERGTSAISSILGIALFNIVPTAFELVLVLVVLLGRFEPAFAIVTLLTVLGYVVFTIATTEWRLRFRREMNEADSRANSRAVDSLLNFETVQYFGNERLEAESYDKALESYERAAVRSQSSLSLLNIGQGVIVAVGVTILMMMAAQGIVLGRLTVGDFVLVNTYLIQLSQPLNIFGWVYRSVKQSLVNMEQMFSLLDERAEVCDREGAIPLPPGPRELRFEDVAFAYDPRRKVLDNLSFTVPPGQRVALVGPSGSGKSTVARLLFRFYDPQSGRITIDGHDLRDLTLGLGPALDRDRPQDTVLFNDTLAYNLRYARPSASDEALEPWNERRSGKRNGSW
ncbi:MAG: ABC transporter ATP-binding protein/permease [Myxococcales bacterium]|nr:ABC transporter ATP-binding protein/permease [Myxococcales bacterium]